MPKDAPQDHPESSAGPYGPKTPTGKSPAAKTPAAKAPVAKTPAAKQSATEKPVAEVNAPVVPPIVAPPAVASAALAPPAALPPAPPAYAPAAAYPYAAGAPKPTTTLSLLAMIFGIVGLVLSCCYGAGVLFGIAGIVLGHLGRKRETAQGMALTGLITGYASAALSIVMWIFLFLIALSPLLMLPFFSSMPGS